MNRFRVGLVILIIGAGLLLASGITYTTQERAKIGPITMEIPQEHQIPYMPVAGVLLVLTGGALMLFGQSRSA